MGSVYNPRVPRFVPIAPTNFDVPAGAAGAVDTDCSAVVPSNALYVLTGCYSQNTTQSVGARAPGETVDTSKAFDAWRPWFNFSNQVNGHIEFYRNATDTSVNWVLGYFI